MTDGRTDRQTLFSRTFPAEGRCPSNMLGMLTSFVKLYYLLLLNLIYVILEMKLRNKNKQKTFTEPRGEPSSSTERSQRYQESIYKRKDAHELYEAKDRAR